MLPLIRAVVKKPVPFLTAKVHTGPFIRLLSYLFELYLLSTGKIKNFDVSLYLYHFYGCIRAVKVKETFST